MKIDMMYDVQQELPLKEILATTKSYSCTLHLNSIVSVSYLGPGGFCFAQVIDTRITDGI